MSVFFARLRQAVLPIYDTLIWLAFLCLLVWASFINDRINDVAWLYFSACAYLLFAAHLLSVCLGGRCNLGGLRLALPTLLVLLSILVLLWAQTVLPIAGALHQSLINSQALPQFTPEWFKPTVVMSVVPQLTRWLLFSEMLMLIVFTLAVSLLCSRRRTIQLLWVLLLVGLLHSLIGMVAKYASVSLVDAAQLDGNFNAARAWFINRNHFASFIVLTMTGALAMQIKYLLSYRDHRLLSLLLDQLITRKAMVLFTLACTFTALLLSQSRAGFLAPILAIVICLFSVGKAPDRFGQRRKLALPVAAFLAIGLVYFGGDLIARLGSDALSLGERGAQWALTWSAIKESWLFGYGGNSYATVFQAMREAKDFRPVLFNQAHNDYLHLWLEQGVLGLSLWLAGLFLVLRQARHAFLTNQSTLVSAVVMAAAITMIAALLQSVVDFNLQILNIRLYFFVIMSMVFSIPTIRQRKGRSTSRFLV